MAQLIGLVVTEKTIQLLTMRTRIKMVSCDASRWAELLEAWCWLHNDVSVTLLTPVLNPNVTAALCCYTISAESNMFKLHGMASPGVRQYLSKLHYCISSVPLLTSTNNRVSLNYIRLIPLKSFQLHQTCSSCLYCIVAALCETALPFVFWRSL